MRILFVADDLYPGFGGQARATEGHISALVARGHRIVVMAGSERAPTPAPDGVRVVRLPSFRLFRSQTRFAWPTYGAIAAEVAESDVVHVNTPTPLAVVTARIAERAGVPVVMGVHTQIETSTLQVPLIGPLLGPLLRVWYRNVFSRADLLVAPTAFARDTARAFTDRRCEVVSNGIDLAKWPPHDKGRPHDGVRRLAYVGRLSREKRPQDLLDLVPLLDDRFELRIAGTGPLETELRRRAAAPAMAGRVHVLGYVSEDQKRALLAGADVFLMPSPAELQSIATLEAMAAGCAVATVGFESSAVPGIVAESGAGVVLPVDDVQAQARALRELLDDEQGLCRAQAKARAYAKTHDLHEVAERLEAHYRALTATGRARVLRAVA
ncbi:MAG: glycosyltransferase family 4 protein [Trueperaceae bacterium]